MQAEHRIHRRRVDPLARAGEPLGDPVGLGPPLELPEVLLAPLPVHGRDPDEGAARDEADEQQPPLELRHQPGRIGPTLTPG
jgi:hypothetical protein